MRRSGVLRLLGLSMLLSTIYSPPAWAPPFRPHETRRFESPRYEQREPLPPDPAALEAQRQSALRRTLAIDRSLPDFGADRLRFTARSDQPETLRDFKRILRTELPGPPPVLSLFLEETAFRSPIREIKAAWGEKGEATELPSDPSQLDLYFSRLSGRTVVLVSHVEEGSLVLGYGSRDRIPIAAVMAAAKRHRVILIPLGCKTAAGGAPVGFLGNISTAEVASFARRLQSRSRFADLIAEMTMIGQVEIDVPGTVQEMSVALQPSDTDLTIKVFDTSSREVITEIRIPVSSLPSSLAPLSPADQALVRAEAIQRGFWLTVVIAPPIVFLTLLGVTSYLRLLAMSQWFLLRRSRLSLLRLVTNTLAVADVAFAASKGVCIFWAVVVGLIILVRS